MALLADATQPFIVNELISVSGRPTLASLAETIIAPVSGFALDFDDTKESISLNFGFPEQIASALAAECYRLSCASFQTIASVPEEVLERDKVAWSMVKLYYSAFYAGHVVARIFGDSFTYLGRLQITRLRLLADAMGKVPAFDIETGLYHCTIKNGATVMDCVRVRAGSGGTHESFWSAFDACLGTVSTRVLGGTLPTADAQEVYAQLEDLRAILSRAGSRSWLSVVRNELQYRQGYSVWFPSQINARNRLTLSGWIRNWNQNPMGLDLRSGRLDPLGSFVIACTFVIALCHTLLQRIAERSTVGNRSFVRHGPMAFINQIQA